MFWFLLLLLTLLAAAFIALPLLKPAGLVRQTGDQRSAFNASLYETEFADLERLHQAGAVTEQVYQERRGELSQRLVDDANMGVEGTESAVDEGRPAHPVLVVALMLCLPMAAWLLYQHLGSWDAHRMSKRIEQIQRANTDTSPDATELMGLLGDLARFNQDREEPDWLFVQAQTAMQIGAYQQAAADFARLSALEPGNAEIIGWQVQALYLARGRQMDPEINELIDLALKISPHQSTVLGIRGMHAFESGDYTLAAQAWGLALAGAAPGSSSARMLQRGIQQANAAMSARSGPQVSAANGPLASMPAGAKAAAPQASVDESADTGFSVGIKVSVALDSAAQVAPGSTVFVIASAPGGGMPYAVVRLPVEGLPTQVLLDDSTAMAPGHSLSRQRAVKITARVSQSGNAMGQAGDWQGRSEVMTPGTVPPVVAIHIDQQI